MNRADAYQGEPHGPIAFMVGNRVAANLLMVSILAAGLVALIGLEREAWPTVPFNTIEVSVAYPGAQPEELEESIIVKIEEQVEALADVKVVKSLAAPGLASVRAELKTGADMGEAMDEVKSAVGRIQSFPGAAERPQFREMNNLLRGHSWVELQMAVNVLLIAYHMKLEVAPADYKLGINPFPTSAPNKKLKFRVAQVTNPI